MSLTPPPPTRHKPLAPLARQRFELDNRQRGVNRQDARSARELEEPGGEVDQVASSVLKAAVEGIVCSDQASFSIPLILAFLASWRSSFPSGTTRARANMGLPAPLAYRFRS
jgi:hypothetical protein